MQQGGCYGYLRREKIEVGSGRHLGSVYVPLRSSLDDLTNALNHPHTEPYDICVDARLLSTYATRPKLLGPGPTITRLTGFVLDAESLASLPARVLSEVSEARIILDLPAPTLPWGLLADSPALEEIRIGPEFASRAGRLAALPSLREVLSRFATKISLSAPSREWIEEEMLAHARTAGIDSIECPLLSTPNPNMPHRKTDTTNVVRGPFEVIHGGPYRSS
jgi:hypothetical protein